MHGSDVIDPFNCFNRAALPFLSFSGLYFLTEYLDNQKRAFLIASAALIATAFMTRYAGAGFVMASVAGIVLLSEERLIKGISDSIIFIFISSFPIFLWFVRNHYSSGRAITAKTSIHVINLEQIKEAILTFTAWMIPGMEPSVTNFILIILVICMFILGHKYLGENKENSVQVKKSV